MADKALEKELEDLRQRLDMYERIFESIYNGAMVVDAEGYITHFNRPYGQFLGVDPAAQIGRHCTEAVENSRMHIVARTGVAEINHSQVIRGQKMVVQRIPILKDGRVIAVFGQVMFKDVRDVAKLARELSRLESKVKIYEEELLALRSTRFTFESILGESEALQALKREAMRAAQNSFPVLITGESGTGKEMFAQAIHHASARRLGPFVRINCAAIPRDLLESELFGYEKGAFTGAAQRRIGKIEQAHGGTVFLDEIGDMPFGVQAKVLRLLQERSIERLGGRETIGVDVRILAATNRDLEAALREGRFREDLYYRLKVVTIPLPPLREHPEDIPLLAEHFLRRFATELGAVNPGITAEALEELRRRPWPGNVRELANVLQKALIFNRGTPVRAEDVLQALDAAGPPPQAHPPGDEALLRRWARERLSEPAGKRRLEGLLARLEAILVREALAMAGGNRSRAARLLGVSRPTLHARIEKFGLRLDVSVTEASPGPPADPVDWVVSGPGG